VSSSPTDTTVRVEMPQMGVSVAEGTIVEWRKQPGDWIEADETICDVSTDKVDVEIPSPASGRVSKILVEPGETVAVGTLLAEVDSAARPGQAHPDEHHPEAEDATSTDGRDTTTISSESAHREEEGAPEAATPPEAPHPAPSARDGELDRSDYYSPVVRRIATEHNVDLNRVTGTGIGGRIRKKDVLAFVEAGDAAGERREPVLHMESPYQAAREREAAGAGAVAGTSPPSPSRREPMSVMRQQIAKHMLASRKTAAHCTTIVEVDLSRVAAERAELRDTMARRGVKLTYLAFVARATVEALEEHPRLNASVDGEEIVYHDDVNLGIAVALESGLIVPVIRRAQRLSLEGTAAAIADLADRARSKRLEPDDVHGGTFTITNPGQFGAVLATPIINQPQVAILDLEAIVKRPVVVTADGTDSIAIRPMTYLCMSWDHRALDGADAARFMGQIKERLESWS
jgi:2-oxoglutarate dehydrogenase dihydrolipoamide succinyltransferase (E2 component)